MIDTKKELEEYVRIIQEKYESSIASEHTLRTPLENLLNATKDKEIKVEHEAKKADWENGTPDFKIFKQIDYADKLSYPNLVGYIECKKLKEDLDGILKSPQIKKYLEVSPNIILTDYNRFILLSFDKVLEDITLLPFGLSKSILFTDDNIITDQIAESFQRLFNLFYGATTRKIKSKKELVKVLSSQAFYLGVKAREFVGDKKNSASKFTKYFTKTYETFQEAVNYDFDFPSFCDILGQSIVYGLFVAHIEKEEAEDIDIISDIASLIPPEFSLLSEFIYFSTPSFNIPPEVQYTIDNIKKTINLIDRKRIAKEMDTNIDGISIYLYEDFLKAFDTLRGTERKKENGVYYTPEPVVKFIVKSIDKALRVSLNQYKGFASKPVKTLDFATGTGSFMAEVFNSIIEQEKSPVFKIDTIKDKFLKDIYGFEMMFVPYIVAHIKLANILKKEGFNGFDDDNKIQVYLTNTLDLEQRTLKMTMPLILLEEEYEKAEQIKNREEVLVILGNPPYNNKSTNRGEKILDLLQTYKEGLNEKKINLDDDYIKFMRFAQWKLLEQRKVELFSDANSGVMGFITNNSYIWGNTHRKMRESLYYAFDEIYILNLHGSDRDPKQDQNVFDIKTGVCIGIFIKGNKEKETNRGANVHYFSTVDNEIYTRSEKFELLQKDILEIDWIELHPNSPSYWFIHRDLQHDEYEDFISLEKVFSVASSGIQTKRDGFTVCFTKDELKEKLNDLLNLTEEQIAKKYLLEDNAGWTITKAQESVTSINTERIQKYLYRPFDKRVVYYNKKSSGILARPRNKVSDNMAFHDNYALIFPRAIQGSVFDYCFISQNIVDIAVGGKNTGSETYFAPLYLYSDNMEGGVAKDANFTYSFTEYIKKKPYHSASPEDILSYIYAILFTPTYRQKYYEYFKTDYPRIPFTDDMSIFEKLSSLGKRLISLHLMENVSDFKSSHLEFVGGRTNNASYVVEKMSSISRYSKNTVYLNQDLCIGDVPEVVWNFTVGGYQVVDKWLKDRVGYECDRDELEHLINVCNAIHETIAIQGEIDRQWKFL